MRKSISISQLAKAVAHKDWMVTFNALEIYAKQGPAVESLPLLKKALRNRDEAVVRQAASCVQKLGAAAKSASEALIKAGERYDRNTGLVPCFSEAIVALASVHPEEPEIFVLIRRNFAADNLSYPKASIAALQSVGTKEAMQLIQQIVAFWLPYANKSERKSLEKALHHSKLPQSIHRKTPPDDLIYVGGRMRARVGY
jgi:hypothetical protein